MSAGRRRPRRNWAGIALLAALAALGLPLVWAALWRPYSVAGDAPFDGFTRAVGVVHVHTALSDGGGDAGEVVAAARAAGLDFVAITDHNVLDAKSLEGYRQGVLVLVGTEISTNAGHLLALGLADPAFRFSGDMRDALDDVRELGGIAFAAHPTSSVPTFRFTGWDLPGGWGVELLNGDSQWRAAGWWRLARTAFAYRVNPEYALLGSLTPPTDALERWDAVLAGRAAPGIVGADAHSRVAVSKRVALRFPSYASVFALARNHVLLPAPLGGAAEADAEAVIAALRQGRSYMSLDALAPGDGFSFSVEAGARRFTMGETVTLQPGLVARVGGRLPPRARLTLLRDGTPFAQGNASLTAEIQERGVYRVEARLPWWGIPWIVSNPIYVFDPGTIEERARRAAWPPASRPPDPALVLESFEGASSFAPEFDARSSMERDVLDAAGGEDGRGAGRIRFRLGTPDAGAPHVWCALVRRASLDLGGRQGLVFSVKADGVYRMWVQLRDENPASGGEGTEWWFASVRTSPTWQRIAVPFSGLRSIDPRTDGRFDADRVRAIVFLIDEASVKPGTAGTVWLDEIGVY
jgi:hypothetical protein